jgi:hypothetical protein
MDENPQDDPNSVWFETQNFGYSEVDLTGQQLLLKSTSASDVLDLTHGFKRVEPYLKPEVNIDIDAKFRLESGTIGFGDALITANNTEKIIQLGTLLYLEGGSPYRELIQLENLSLSGLYVPEDDGWVKGSNFALSSAVFGQNIKIVQETGNSGYYEKSIPVPTFDGGSRIFEARLKFDEYVQEPLTANTGVFIAADAGQTFSSFLIGMKFVGPLWANPPKVTFYNPNPANFDPTGVDIQAYDFDWDDGEFHTYRVLVDFAASTVVLVIDDIVQGPAMNLLSFNPAPTNNKIRMGVYPGIVPFNTHSSTVEWDSLSYTKMAPLSVKRTLGIWLGGDRDDINSWEIPRTDATTAPNSSNLAVVEEMDWRSMMELRVHHDVTWGVTVFRPDLPPPPYFTGDFATQITEPSAGWINVEQNDLPAIRHPFGYVEFGALDSRSISQQRWDYVKYRLYTHRHGETFSSPEHMVLNQFLTVNSGELLNDVTVETVTVESLSSTTVSLIPANYFADRVFNLVDGSTVISPNDFTFNRESQTVHLSSGTTFSGEHVPITLSFAPGNPITQTYLLNQPLMDSMILLNEDTPPHQKSQVGNTERQAVHGGVVTDPTNHEDTIDNSPYRTVEFSDDEEYLYDLEFFEVDNDGQRDLIKPFCDNEAPDHGLAELGLEGGLEFTEQNFGTPKSPLLESSSILEASGGVLPPDGVLGPVLGGSAIMFPNQQPPNLPVGSQAMGVNQQVQIIMIDGGVITLKKDF